jgi:hypothetical protein
MKRRKPSILVALGMGAICASVALAAGGAFASDATPTDIHGFDYPVSAGPVLTPSEAAEAASRYGRESGESGELDISVARGTDGQASALTNGRPVTEPAMASDPRVEAWRQSAAYLVVMTGRQFSPSVPLKRGAPAPAGSVLALILDAHNGNLEGIDLGSEAPDIAELGDVTELVVASGSTKATISAVVAPVKRPVVGRVAGTLVLGGGPRGRKTTVVRWPRRVVVKYRGRIIRVTHTNAIGAFTTRLPVGNYTLQGRVGDCPPQKVAVKANHTAHVTLRCSIR